MRTFALLTCDSVAIDEATGKHSIFGHFSSINVSALPARHPTLTFFVGLTDLPAGEHTVEIRFGPPLPIFSSPTTNSKLPISVLPPELMRTLLTQKMTSTSTNEKSYLITELKDLTFDREGDWQLEVVVDKLPLGKIALSIAHEKK
jgi:hypothetical protein